MSTPSRAFAVFVAVTVFCVVAAGERAEAQTEPCRTIACGDADTGGGVAASTPSDTGADPCSKAIYAGLPSCGGGGGQDGGAAPAGDPCSEARYAGLPRCVQEAADRRAAGGGLPICVTQLGVTINEPCTPAGAPCIGFPDPANPNPCGNPIAPPDIPPPTLGEMGQNARDQVAWPVIDPHPKGYAGQILVAGFEHSLVTWGYEDWAPLNAQASITKTVVASGQAFSETFTASLDATPVEVRWDTGPNNNQVTRHNPPTTVTCVVPGDVSFHLSNRPFQDWRSYSGYGGPECKFVWWGLSDDVGTTTTITAELVWDLVLTTDWDGAVTNIGQHVESYSSGGWSMNLPSAVNVNEGSWETSDVDLPGGN